MIKYYINAAGTIEEKETAVKNCWICVTAPTPQEIDFLINEYCIEPGFLKSATDEEEISHIDKEDGQTLVIIDTPFQEKQEQGDIIYYTMPLSFIVMPEYIVTISLKPVAVLEDAAAGRIKALKTAYKTNFILNIILGIATKYIIYLRQIDKISVATESTLHRSMRNKELIQLLGLEKSLVYFSTGLKSTETTLEKILKGRTLKLYPDDEDLLEDAITEIKQSIETCSIYSGILSGTMDAFASIISNNLNIVMKVMTSITIVLAIPNIVFGFYGMNATDLPFPKTWFAGFIALFLCGISAYLLYKKGYFNE